MEDEKSQLEKRRNWRYVPPPQYVELRLLEYPPPLPSLVAVSVEDHELVLEQSLEIMESVPGRSMDCRVLYSASIAASKDLIVSRGRSQRGRVGFERSGSAAEMLAVIGNSS